jgi:hypothetical protein
MTSTVDVRAFAFRQGPGKRLLGEQNPVDDAAPTTSRVPPAAARGGTGRPLPTGTQDLLAATPFPSRCPTGPDDGLGHALQAAFGLQRREPSHGYDDHRGVASGRARYPVHALVTAPGAVRYLDPYRLALVDAGAPASGDPAVLLAARYTDLPDGYGRLRYAVCETELGVNLRALCVAADVFRVPVAVDLDPATVRAAEATFRATGPGTWSAPVPVRLPGYGDAPPSVPLPGGATSGQPVPAGGPDVVDCQSVSRARLDLPTTGPVPATGLVDTEPAGQTWADVLWHRSAGRVPGGRYGFSLMPHPLDPAAVGDMLRWLRRPPPHPLLAAVAARVTTLVALQRVTGLPTGVYEVDAAGRLALRHRDPRVLADLERGFGRPSSATTDIGLRHAGAVWVSTVDVGALVDDLGPAALSLLHLWLGWSIHGGCLAAAAHGLIARPARSYDEYHLRSVLRLGRRDTPVFLTACGRSRFLEPMLDLRP